MYPEIEMRERERIMLPQVCGEREREKMPPREREREKEKMLLEVCGKRETQNWISGERERERERERENWEMDIKRKAFSNWHEVKNRRLKKVKMNFKENKKGDNETKYIKK